MEKALMFAVIALLREVRFANDTMIEHPDNRNQKSVLAKKLALVRAAPVNPEVEEIDAMIVAFDKLWRESVRKAEEAEIAAAGRDGGEPAVRSATPEELARMEGEARQRADARAERNRLGGEAAPAPSNTAICPFCAANYTADGGVQHEASCEMFPGATMTPAEAVVNGMLLRPAPGGALTGSAASPQIQTELERPSATIQHIDEPAPVPVPGAPTPEAEPPFSA